MADFLTINAPLGISKLPEATLNQMATLQSDFLSVGTDHLSVVMPQVEKFTNSGRMGNANAWGSAVYNEYVTQPQITYSDRLNLNTASRLILRGVSGATVSETSVGTNGLFSKQWNMQQPFVPLGELQSSTVAMKYGGIDLLLGGMVVNQWQITGQDGQAPQFSAQLVGTGRMDYMSSQSPALVLPTYADPKYLGISAGSGTSGFAFQMNDGTAFNLSQIGRLKAYTLSFNNNVILNDRRAGDPSNSIGGNYVTRMRRGDVSVDLAVQVYIDQNRREWADHLSNVVMSTTTIQIVRQIGDVADGGSMLFNIRNGVIVNPSVADDGHGRLILSFHLLVLDTDGHGPLYGTFITANNPPLS